MSKQTKRTRNELERLRLPELQARAILLDRIGLRTGDSGLLTPIGQGAQPACKFGSVA